MTAVAYVVVTWNNRGIIGECLRSVVSQAGVRPEIFVIDNASADGTADYIADTFPEVHLTRSVANTGFARGNNQMIARALRSSDVDYVALVNSDAVLDENWTDEILAHIAELANVAAAQGKTVDYRDRAILDSEYIYIGQNLQCVQAGYGRRVSTASKTPQKVFGVNAAAAIYTRQFIEQQRDGQLFDERFYMYLEDVDVAFRAFMAGWDSYSVPAATAHHMGSASAQKRPNGYATYMVFRNQSAVVVKNMPLSVLLRALPRAVVSELRLYGRLWQSAGPRIALAAVRGRLVGLLRLPIYLGSRYRLRRQATVPSTDLREVIQARGSLSVCKESPEADHSTQI